MKEKLKELRQQADSAKRLNRMGTLLAWIDTNLADMIDSLPEKKIAKRTKG